MACAIMVMEDDADNLIAIIAVLDSLEYEYIAAGDGREGVRMATENRPGLFLMDIELSVLSGLEAAAAMPSERDKILETGCSDYISRPLDLDEESAP